MQREKKSSKIQMLHLLTCVKEMRAELFLLMTLLVTTSKQAVSVILGHQAPSRVIAHYTH